MQITEEQRKAHWDKIYSTKQTKDASWYQQKPSTSLELIKKLNLPKSAKIFDNGTGDSSLVDNLLKLGYENITVQDISAAALEKVKKRLGDAVSKVRWIVADEAHCNPKDKYDLWHDRAAFHFLTDSAEIKNYVNTIKNCINPGGHLIIATFSESGPKKCSGLDVKQYSEANLLPALPAPKKKEDDKSSKTDSLKKKSVPAKKDSLLLKRKRKPRLKKSE